MKKSIKLTFDCMFIILRGFLVVSGQGEIKYIRNINVGQDGIVGRGHKGCFPLFLVKYIWAF